MTCTHTIWSLVLDNDDGTSCQLFATEAEADAACMAIMVEAWAGRADPIPATWREAWEEIEAEGCDFWVVLDWHEIALPCNAKTEA